MKLIEKKIDSNWFNEIALGIKPFEIRIDEDDLQEDDIVVLQEYVNGHRSYRKQIIQVKKIYGREESLPGLKKGYIIFTFDKLINERYLNKEE